MSPAAREPADIPPGVLKVLTLYQRLTLAALGLAAACFLGADVHDVRAVLSAVPGGALGVLDAAGAAFVALGVLDAVGALLAAVVMGYGYGRGGGG